MKFNKHQLLRIGPYLLIGAFYIFALLVIGIGGDFPLNDDWAYAEGVRHLLLGESLIMPNVCAAAIAHVALGFLSVKMLGYSYVSLRICSFLITIAGALAFFSTAASLRISRSQATFLTLLYASNPILLNIAFGFMSDSTALAMNMIFLACLARGLAKRTLTTMVIAFLVLAIAVSVRQSALIFVVLSPFCLSKRFAQDKLKIAVFVIAFALPTLSAWACDQWLMSMFIESGSTNIGYDLVRKAHSSIIQKCLFSAPDMVLPFFSAVAQVLCYLALFCLPALCALVPLAVGLRVRTFISFKLGLAFAIVIVASSLITVLHYHQTMPFSENILRATTVGAQGVLGIIRPPIDERWRIMITVGSALAAALLAVLLGGFCRSLSKQTMGWRSIVTAVSLVITTLFLVLETVVRCTDRYYLIALGPVLLALGLIAKQFKQSLLVPISIVLSIAICWYSICGNQEYLSSNRARWKGVEWLEARGVKSPLIDGGYEYNTLRDITIYNTTYRGEPPRDAWRWWPVKGEKYLVSLSAVPGYKTIHFETYYSFFDRKDHRIEVLERDVASR